MKIRRIVPGRTLQLHRNALAKVGTQVINAVDEYQAVYRWRVQCPEPEQLVE